jgi:tetratricopeptide (TPR) repeat protein
VVLYELLTGTTPFAPETFRQAAFDEMRRIIREEEPPKPSTRLSKDEGRRMKDDSKRSGRYRFWPHSSFSLHPSSFQELDWIVMKALEKDRRRRYETAKDFAADVMRHLADQPVEACPPSATYRLRKLARKHRAALVTLAGFATVILMAAIVSTLLAIRATTAERLASQRLTESEAVSRRLVAMFGRTVPTLDGRQLKVVDLLDQATRDLDAEFSGASKIKGELLHTLGGTYFGLGLYDRAGELLSRALSVRQATLGPDHPDTLLSMYDLAVIYMKSGRSNEALPIFEEALKLRKARLGPDHPDTLESMFGLAWVYQETGRIDEGISMHEKVLRLRTAGLGPDDPDTLHSMKAVADGYWANGRIDEAILLHEETLQLRKAKLGPDNRWTLQSMESLASTYVDTDRLDEAIRLSEEALELSKVRLGPDHPETRELVDIHARALGRKRLQKKEYAMAEPLLREDQTRRKAVMPNAWQRFHSESLLGASLLGQKKFGDAEPLLITGYKGMKERKAEIPTTLKHHLPEAGERVVRLYDDWGKPEKAADWRAKLASKPCAESNKPKP